MHKYKFEVGQKVLVHGYTVPRIVESQNVIEGVIMYSLKDRVGMYRESQLVAIAQPNIDGIKVKYEIDGLTFDTMEEAKDHERNIKLFQLIREKSPLIECDTVLLDVLRIFVSERSRVVEIMK